MQLEVVKYNRLTFKDKEDIIEIECEECKAEFEIRHNEADNGDPVYCPFCGADLNYDWDEDSEEEEDYEDI